MSAELLSDQTDGENTESLLSAIEHLYQEYADLRTAGMHIEAESVETEIKKLRFHHDMIYSAEEFKQLMVDVQTEECDQQVKQACDFLIKWATSLCPSAFISFVFDEHTLSLNPTLIMLPPAQKTWKVAKKVA